MERDRSFASNPNKDFLRRCYDLPIIERWRARAGRPLKYLGLPAWQMLDIVEWQGTLGRFTGIEREENQQHLMFLTANVRDLEHRLHSLYGEFDDILLNGRDRYGKTPEWPYDIVNLDYFGGFIYSRLSRPKAFEKLITNQAAYERSFLLIVTQHLRDRDSLREKDEFLADLGRRLKGAVVDAKLHRYIDNVVAWHRDADIPDAARQGLYMNFFFRETGEPQSFKVRCRPGIVYSGTGNSSMIHFVTDFIYQPKIAHRAASDQSLIEVINLGLVEARAGRLRNKTFHQPKIPACNVRPARKG